MHVIPQSPVRKVKVITVIEVMTIAGEGTPDSPTRNITQYWDMEGNLLAVVDPEAYGVSAPLNKSFVVGLKVGF